MDSDIEEMFETLKAELRVSADTIRVGGCIALNLSSILNSWRFKQFTSLRVWCGKTVSDPQA
jgi:hypothetical protein